MSLGEIISQTLSLYEKENKTDSQKGRYLSTFTDIGTDNHYLHTCSSIKIIDPLLFNSQSYQRHWKN